MKWFKNLFKKKEVKVAPAIGKTVYPTEIDEIDKTMEKRFIQNFKPVKPIAVNPEPIKPASQVTTMGFSVSKRFEYKEVRDNSTEQMMQLMIEKKSKDLVQMMFDQGFIDITPIQNNGASVIEFAVTVIHPNDARDGE